MKLALERVGTDPPMLLEAQRMPEASATIVDRQDCQPDFARPSFSCQALGRRVHGATNPVSPSVWVNDQEADVPNPALRVISQHSDKGGKAAALSPTEDDVIVAAPAWGHIGKQIARILRGRRNSILEDEVSAAPFEKAGNILDVAKSERVDRC